MIQYALGQSTHLFTEAEPVGRISIHYLFVLKTEHSMRIYVCSSIGFRYLEHSY